MASSIEAEMARFEEEISSVNDKNDLPSIPPPPMFLPHALQAKSASKESSHAKTELEPPITSPQLGFRPRGPAPNMSRPSRPGFSGPEPMGPMMSNPVNFGPMGPGPLASGPVGPNMMGPHSMPRMTGPMGMNAMPGGPMGLNRPNMDSSIGTGPMPPPMPTFFPPPIMPDFGAMSKQQQSVYSAAPVLKKKTEENDSNKSKKKGEKEGTKTVASAESSQASLSKNDDRLSEIGPEAGPHVVPPKVAPMPVIMAQTTFGGQPALYGLSPLAGNPQMAKAASQGKKKKIIRTAAGQKWEDPSLLDWDPNDYRIFCGDLGNEVTDDTLARIFSRYSSFQKARVVREKNSKKSKGYGFVSFKDPTDFIRAMREINGKYVGNRPIKLRKSNWKDRNIDIVRKKVKEKKKLGYKV